MDKTLATPIDLSAGKALLAGGVAALLASACCLAPLVLVLAGVSGAWIGNLAALEPYQPIFAAASAVALFFAWRRIWRPADCAPDAACAAPRVNRLYKFLFVAATLLLLAAIGFPLIAPWFY